MRHWFIVGAGPELRTILAFPREAFSPEPLDEIRILVERGKGNPGEQLYGVPVSGYLEAMQFMSSPFALLAATGRPDTRMQLIQKVLALPHRGLTWAKAVHPHATVEGVDLGEDVIVHPGAVIEPGASIGAHVSIGPNAVVGPGCVIGSYCTIGAGAILSYKNYVGSGAWIGSGVVVGPQCSIGAWAKVDPGAVIHDAVVEKGIHVTQPGSSPTTGGH